MATQLRRKHIAFIDAYTTPKSGGYLNSAESARIAGFSIQNPKNAGKIGHILLKRPDIQIRVDSILDKRKTEMQSRAEITKEELTALVKESLEEVDAKHANKPRYYEIIARLRGFWADVVQNNLMVYNGTDPEVRQSVDAKLAHFSRQLSRRPATTPTDSKSSKE